MSRLFISSNQQEEILQKIDLGVLIEKFRPSNPEALDYYLQDVWKDLSERNNKKGFGLTFSTFESYYNLPVIIGKRLFNVLNTKEFEYLTQTDFVNGLKNLYLGDYKTLIHIMFSIYDYNRDGQISRNDIKIVFNYIPLKSNEIYCRYKIRFENDNVNDRKESINEINKTLNKIFEEEYIDEDCFKYSIENINSDPFIFLLIYLYEKRPFNEDTIEHYKKLALSKTNRINRATTTSGTFGGNTLKLIVSPSPKSKFKPALAVSIKEEGDYKRFISTSSNLINIKYRSPNNNHTPAFGKGLFKRVKTFNFKNIKNIKKIKTIVNEQDEEYEDDGKSPKNHEKKPSKSNLEEEEEEEENEEEIKKNLKYEGYLLKIRKDGELKKLYFKLIYHDLYFFKSQTDVEHGGIHNLCDVFIKEGNPYNYNGRYLYCFSILYPEKERNYYTEDKEEYKKWVKYLRKAVDYEDLYKIYEIKDKINSGRLGDIRIGKHKIKDRLVAIKIVNKKTLDPESLENIRNQIKILKMANDECVLHLLDIIENESYLYIITELCKGGDLYSYLNQKSFKIQEARAAKIILSLVKTVSFLHNLGIIHRDLKPENILLTEDSENTDIRISDFCISKILGPSETTNEIVGTLGYMAPEVLLGMNYNVSVDIWSIGIIAYLLLTGYLPFDDEESEKEIIRKTLYEPVPFDNDSWKNISFEAKDFIKKILVKEKEKRASIEDLLKSKWLQNYAQMEEENE